MNLEQIDTSTTAGKIRVMALSEEGRRVAIKYSYQDAPDFHEIDGACIWDWLNNDYAIISEPVGPEEVWCVIGAYGETVVVGNTRAGVENFGGREGTKIVRYLRADLAGENDQ